MDGKLFSADKPVVILNWPTRSAVTAFDNKMSAWNYLESATRKHASAIFARVYEFQGDRWERVPALPTYLKKLEESKCEAHDRWQHLSQAA
jgi:hypothetical protein